MQGWNILLKKIIRTGAGRNRHVLAMAGLAIAVLLILTAVQIQANYRDLLYKKNNRDSIANFLVVNKIITDQNLGTTGLSDNEINDLRKQDFVESVGLLTPSHFKASIQSASDRFPFYTDIAFESVPQEFIDIAARDWKWDEHALFVPIIAPNMFLDFYNFQFSFSQGLPQLTQQVVKMIVFKINLHGPNGMVTLNGRVVGFSDRISSLLVPEAFMKWGNQFFAKKTDRKPSRIIIKTKDPGNPQLSAYLKEQGLSADADKTRFSRYRKIVDMVVNISGLTGIILLLFALLVFTLFIQLTVASSRDDIQLLIILGTSPAQLHRFLVKRFLPGTWGIILLAFLLLGFLQFLIYRILAARGIHISILPDKTTALTAMLIAVTIGWVTSRSIKKYIHFPLNRS
ncbi:MAG: hypothetical protein HYU71_09185 [Bacteroidetes bacterium]|nr:hypothetical protein [Bacteroidota bacterium]